MFKYLLKPSVIPAITVMGMDIAALLSNAFLVELVFNWPGFSRLGIEFMLNKDLNGIVALVLIIGIIYAVINVITDVIVAYLDPRIRLMERGE
jgi:peptide/nickel transport system permease protein